MFTSIENNKRTGCLQSVLFRLKRFSCLNLLLYLFCLSLMALVAADGCIKESTKESMFVSVGDIPKNRVGLLLGTSKYISNGSLNHYWKYRIEAAVELFKAGKVDYIIVSGDNSKDDYDEPTNMKADLMEAGVPENRIVLDYAGFRTLDSVVRCKEIFSQDSCTIISQRFHNERAIYLAQQNGIVAIGYNAKDVNVFYGFKTMLREKLARVKLFVDLMVGKKPKFGGEKVKVGE